MVRVDDAYELYGRGGRTVLWFNAKLVLKPLVARFFRKQTVRRRRSVTVFFDFRAMYFKFVKNFELVHESYGVLQVGLTRFFKKYYFCLLRLSLVQPV